MKRRGPQSAVSHAPLNKWVWVFLCLGLTGCFTASDTIPGTLSSSTPSILTSGFAGATSAANLSGSAIKVTWGSVPSGTSRLTIFNLTPAGTMSVVASPSVASSSYTISGLTPNAQYTYIVQAFDSSGNSDGNTNAVTAMTYAGITSAGANSTSSAFFLFGAPSVGSGVNVYCANLGGSYTLIGSTAGSSSSSLIVTSGLSSGTTYSCRAQGVSAATGLEDTNTATFTFQMASLGFGQLSSGVLSSSAYSGVELVQAFGPALNAPTNSTVPAATPSASPTVGVSTPNVTTPWNGTTPEVILTWNNFNILNPSQAEYRVERVSQGVLFNMNSTTPCTSSTTTSCQVCLSTTQTNSFTRSCTDTNVGLSPARYEYAVSLIINSSLTPPQAEELPTTYNSGVLANSTVIDAPFRILVPIPPAYMALVQRDSVNFEECGVLGQTPDPLNHQRCSYSGLGAIPYSTSKGGVSNKLILTGNTGTSAAGSINAGTYFDFGYDLFVDRFGAGCNWTQSTNGGKCGTGATSGDCTGSTAGNPPSNSIGTNGNVYYDAQGPGCYVMQSGSWTAVNSTSLTQATLQAVSTNVPKLLNSGASRSPTNYSVTPPMSYINQSQSYQICQATIDPNYGAKRLLRRREQVASAAFPWLQGDPNYLTSEAITALQDGFNHPLTQACNSNGRSGVTNTAFESNAEAAGAVSGPSTFVIGSDYTAQCVSRYGIQDLVGNVWTWVSDQVSSCSTTTHTCFVGDSPLDAGNQDMTYIESYNFDGTTGPGSTTAGQTGPNYTTSWNFWTPQFGGNYFSPPLGMPFVTNDHGNALQVGSQISTTLLHTDSISVGTDAGVVTRGIYAGGYATWGANSGRYALSMTAAPSQSVNTLGFRCVLPAE